MKAILKRINQHQFDIPGEGEKEEDQQQQQQQDEEEEEEEQEEEEEEGIPAEKTNINCLAE